MKPAHLHRIIPLERFREIIAAFDFDHQTWRDAYWMRIAAQVAVLCPDNPTIVAKRITLIANELLKKEKWFAAFSSPMRFVIAAVLVQTNTKLVDFLHDYKRLGESLDRVGLKHGGRYEPISVLILRMNPEHQSFSLLEAERLKNIYKHMKNFHWWITGIDDLPACAALSQISGSAEILTAEAEGIYQRLLGSGLQRGNHLQNAANLLPLTGLKADEAADRFLGLLRQAEIRNITIMPEHYDALSVLSLLEQPPAMVIERMLAVRKELDLCNPDLKGSSSFALAADLTALDLVRYDAQSQPLQNAEAGEKMLQRLHALNMAMLVQVSHIDMTLDFDTMGELPVAWPYV
jgi:hypothetical protein